MPTVPAPHAGRELKYEDELLDMKYEDDEEYPKWIPGELEL